MRNTSFLATTAVALILAVQSAGAGDGSPCLVGRVPASLRLPDGSVHPAGELRICLARELSPVQGLHQVSVDGVPIGLFASSDAGLRKDTGGADALFRFRRNGGQALELEGYSVGSVSYRFAYSPSEIVARAAPPGTQPREPIESTVRGAPAPGAIGPVARR